MFTLRRWWDKNALKLAGVGAVVGSTYLVLQTQSGLVFEAYNLISQPFRANPMQLDAIKTARVEQLQNELRELQRQNKQLKRLADYSTTVPTKGVLAPIVMRSADNWWQQVTLGRGSADGIAVDDIVVGVGGIVGRVVSISPHTSRVLLVSDPNSRIGVLVGRTNNMGILQGTRANQAVLQFFDKRPTAKKGDVVVTSIVSQLFPTGLSVGRIVEINLNKSPAPEAIVQVTAPLAYLEWVTVHPHNPHAAAAPTSTTPTRAKVTPAAPAVKPQPPTAPSGEPPVLRQRNRQRQPQ